jgi:dinuclear metal center YbgI/SA1388 family protein
MTTISELIAHLENLAPRSMQESYDNSGLLIGNKNAEITGVLVALDCVESVVDEAIANGCNVIVAHHPLIFKGLKRITGNGFVERTVEKCIKNGIAVYAMHTNFDNYHLGVNAEFGRRLGLTNLRILAPKSVVLYKLVVFCPENEVEQLNDALFKAGAGHIGNYSHCHFVSDGMGSFQPEIGANPKVGEVGSSTILPEKRLEYLVSEHRLAATLLAMRGALSYEEIAHDLIKLSNSNQQEGSGMVGELPEAMSAMAFLKQIKATFGCGAIRYTAAANKEVRKVAFCGGSGSFLLGKAIASGADVFVTADFKYHEFFDADGQIIIADIGHYESEQFTSNLLVDILTKNFSTFAVRLSELNTNPINYL